MIDQGSIKRGGWILSTGLLFFLAFQAGAMPIGELLMMILFFVVVGLEARARSGNSQNLDID